MKILILSQFFEPEPSAKGLPFARELQRRGHSIEVLTGFPNYPGGRVYPGYNIRTRQRETMEGIRVIRVPLYPSHDKSAIRRILNYGTFALSAATLGALSITRPDVVYVYHPPTTISLASTLIRHLHKVPIVADIQDLWPDTVLETGMLRNPLAIRMLNLWCHFAFRQMDQIVAQSPGIREELIRRGIPPERVHVIYNWCNESVMHMRPRDESVVKRWGLEGRFNVFFAGTMGIQQGLDTVLEAAQICVHAAPKAQFVFVGGGIDRERLEQKVSAMGLTNVRFLPRQPQDAMGPLLAAADVLLVHLRDLPLFRITIPSKTQAYLAAGRPILMAVRGDAADLVLQSNSGFCSPPEDSQGLVERIASFERMSLSERSALGTNGAEYYRKNLSLSVGVDNFERVFELAVSNYS